MATEMEQPLPWRLERYTDDNGDPFYIVHAADDTVVLSNEEHVKNVPMTDDAEAIALTMNRAWLRQQRTVWPPELPEKDRWYVEEAALPFGVGLTLSLHLGTTCNRRTILADGNGIDTQPDDIDRDNFRLASLAPEALHLLALALQELAHLASDPKVDAFLDRAAGLVLRAQKKETTTP